MPHDPAPIRADVVKGNLVLDLPRLTRKLAALPPEAPVVAMIHGWRYAPAFGADCPHGSILSLNPSPKDVRAISWPRHLQLDGQSGQAIALGWQARCGLWTAHARARQASVALAAIAEAVAHLSPGRQLHVIAHSMGARVALNALFHAKPGTLGRMILMTPTESRRLSAEAMQTSAGRAAQIVNVTTRENDLFDAGYEWGVHLGLRTSVGQGLGLVAPNWRDLWIDHPDTLRALAALGHHLPSPPRRVSHWSPYLRPGIFGLYRALIDGSLPLAALPAPRPARRWSLLLSLPLAQTPLPSAKI
jgi:hypothetical protein